MPCIQSCDLSMAASSLTPRPLPAYSCVFFKEESLLEKFFHLAENQTTVRRELLGGLTTFMAMAYVVAVNPRILGEAGMPVEGVLFATCISAAIATLIMGLWARSPFEGLEQFLASLWCTSFHGDVCVFVDWTAFAEWGGRHIIRSPSRPECR